MPTKARPLRSDEGWQVKGQLTWRPSTRADLAALPLPGGLVGSHHLRFPKP